MDKEFRRTIARLSRRHRASGPPRRETEFFFICEECGQAVDKRSTAQVFHHEELGHQRLTETELTELSLAEKLWPPSSDRQ